MKHAPPNLAAMHRFLDAAEESVRQLRAVLRARTPRLSEHDIDVPYCDALCRLRQHHIPKCYMQRLWCRCRCSGYRCVRLLR